MPTLATFSPTGGAIRIARRVMTAMFGQDFRHLDLTRPESAGTAVTLAKDDLLLVAVPVHYGRVPDLARQRLSALRGNGTPAVLVVVYGNRDFDDALLELQELAGEAGFRAVAAAAFVAEHSFSLWAVPLAAGRPDAVDLMCAEEFGRVVKARLERPGCAEPLALPGANPYREKPARVPTVPTTVARGCRLCGRCALACPAGAISLNPLVTTDQDRCLLCCACTRVCPSGSRTLEGDWVEGVRARLALACAERREPVFFVGAGCPTGN